MQTPTSQPCKNVSQLHRAGWLKIDLSWTPTKLSFYWSGPQQNVMLLNNTFPWISSAHQYLRANRLETLVFCSIPVSLFPTTYLPYLELVMPTLESLAESGATSALRPLKCSPVPLSVADWITVTPSWQVVLVKIFVACRFCRTFCVEWSADCPGAPGFLVQWNHSIGSQSGLE